jgi:Mg2+ and Co2+ transporter CorA
MAGIPVLSLAGNRVEERAATEVGALPERPEALVWVDIPECTEGAISLLTDVLECHPPAVRDCMQRNRVPRVRIYPHRQLLILHGPERGPSGHVHYPERDQIIGEKYVVTVRGPINPALSVEVPLREIEEVRRRLTTGRLRPDSPYELSRP